MELFGYNVKRLLVIVSAIIIVSLTATDLANDQYKDVGSKVIKYIVLFVAVAGFVGVMQNVSTRDRCLIYQIQQQ